MKRRKAQRRKGYRGFDINVPLEEMIAAGWPVDAPPPFYRVTGYQRSAKGRTVIVTLYDEP